MAIPNPNPQPKCPPQTRATLTSTVTVTYDPSIGNRALCQEVIPPGNPNPNPNPNLVQPGDVGVVKILQNLPQIMSKCSSLTLLPAAQARTLAPGHTSTSCLVRSSVSSSMVLFRIAFI